MNLIRMLVLKDEANTYIHFFTNAYGRIKCEENKLLFTEKTYIVGMNHTWDLWLPERFEGGLSLLVASSSGSDRESIDGSGDGDCNKREREEINVI